MHSWPEPVTEREKDSPSDREKERHPLRDREKDTLWETERQTHPLTDREKDTLWETERQTHPLRDREKDTLWETERQTHPLRERERERERGEREAGERITRPFNSASNPLASASAWGRYSYLKRLLISKKEWASYIFFSSCSVNPLPQPII